MIISPDDYLLETDPVTGAVNYVWTESRVLAAWGRANFEICRALRSGEYRDLVLLIGVPGAGKSTWLAANHKDTSLYLDAVLARRKNRRAYIEICREVRVPVRAVWVNTPLEVCLARNALRPPGRAPSEEKMQAMYAPLRGHPPSLGEGYASLTVVTPESVIRLEAETCG